MIHPYSSSLLRIFLFALTFFFIRLVYGGEGMWLPFLLKSLNESEMKSMGMKMNAEDIYSINHGSLKDAVVHFGGFCTAEVVSDQGLLLTNHHCGYASIQEHSTLENNYIKNGFWASSHKSEIPNPGLYATFIISIDDVTDSILSGIKDDMDAKTKQSIIDANINLLRTGTIKESWQEVMVKPFYEGNQYYRFITETYTDVRYVGSPPESIGKFGADTDNWV
ncbi:MAG: S46 family peptidase, partial [Saprospiraceae bacterium]